MSELRYDLVVFGATSFVGKILCRYLRDEFGTAGGLRWAAAARSKTKLETLRAELGIADLPLLVADAADSAALHEICAHTRVIASTVGPYALYGEPLLQACVESGTDYCDLTGEVQWIRRMLDAYEDQARDSGARIVHCCGFDSIPSDLGVLFLQRQAMKRLGAPCSEVHMGVRALRGGVSGGTVASLLNAIREAAADPDLRRQMGNPYALCPPAKGDRPRQPSVRGPQYDQAFEAWVTPFVMEKINSRIVHRSHALLGEPWGRDFTYTEAVLTGRGLGGRLRATGQALGLAGFGLAAALPPTRWLLQRYVLPAPGEGPTPAQQESGFFDLRFHGQTRDGRALRIKVTGDRDPGYGSTAKMLGQAAACLAQDLEQTTRAGGFWTPASLMGQRLIDRLQARAGLNFVVLD
ncbi:MAG: saccharopine dehydrogenase family protein [Steroidobacteraceae bacterium]